jgi:hypothetical protein
VTGVAAFEEVKAPTAVVLTPANNNGVDRLELGGDCKRVASPDGSRE